MSVYGRPNPYAAVPQNPYAQPIPPSAPPQSVSSAPLLPASSLLKGSGSVAQEVCECPTLTSSSGYQPLFQFLSVELNCELGLSFVKLEATFFNGSQEFSDFVFELPKSDSATVMKCSAAFGQRVVESVVIDLNDTSKLAAATNDMPVSPTNAENSKWQMYQPKWFRFPLSRVDPSVPVCVRVEYFQPMEFNENQYSITIPTAIPTSLLPANLGLNQVVSVVCSINTGTSMSKWQCTSHPMRILSQDITTISLRSDGSQTFSTSPFMVSYSMWSEQILSSMFSLYDWFVLFIAPPKPGSVQSVHGRSVVFLIDQSYSMSGAPLQNAKAALKVALSDLKPNDVFNIIAFDDRMYPFRQQMLTATSSNIVDAQNFVSSIHENGCTDIMTPIQKAVEMIHVHQKQGVNAAKMFSLPFVFLFTDGAVPNEREICDWTLKNARDIRFCTMAIGSYANAYFLRMLADIGRGFSDTILSFDELERKMISFIRMAEKPILTNIKLESPALRNAETFPNPFPDLYCGRPVVISGRLAALSAPTGIANIPGVTLRGDLPDGVSYTHYVSSVSSIYIPIQTLVCKQRLESLSARAWLTSDEKLKAQIIEESCTASMPCVYTTMVACEVDPVKKQQQAQQQRDEDASAHSRSSKTLQKKNSKSSSNVALIAACGVGAVFVLACTPGPALFGNLAATAGNALVSSSFVSIADTGFSVLWNGFSSAGGTVLNGLEGAGSFVLSSAWNGMSWVGSEIGSGINAIDASSCCDCYQICNGCICDQMCKIPCDTCTSVCESVCSCIGDVDCGSCTAQVGNCVFCFCKVFCEILGALAN
eukprot:ANDGO_04042.mRNA.1 von Willebrand factor A domain-containing protein DDB_G0292028